MLYFIGLHLDSEETLINVDNIVQVKRSATTTATNLCEIITVNGVVRPDESYSEVSQTLMALNSPRFY